LIGTHAFLQAGSTIFPERKDHQEDSFKQSAINFKSIEYKNNQLQQLLRVLCQLCFSLDRKNFHSLSNFSNSIDAKKMSCNKSKNQW